MTPDLNDRETRKPRNPVGVGAPVALLIIAGVIVGGLLGQPSIGFLGGVGAALLVVLLSWTVSRRK